MNSHFEIALLLIAVLLLLILLLWQSNIKKREERYHQFLSAAFAPVYALLVFIFYHNNTFAALFSWLRNFWERNLDITLQDLWWTPLTAFTFYLLALLLYIPVKRLLIWLLRSGRLTTSTPATQLGIYEKREERVLLKNDYYYPLKYMYVSVLIFSVIYGLLFFSYVVSASFAPYGILLVFIFLEIFWFLHGIAELDEIEIESVSSTPEKIDFYPLWEEYKEIWAENLSLAFIRRSKHTKWPPAEVGGEMLIKNYKQNAMFRSIHKHMVDLLNKGKKIIIFIPDNFQPLARLEDSDMYQIVKEILFGFDYTSQFVTTEMMNLKLEASIFITSIDKFLLYSTNIEEDYELFNWFKDLRLVLYFEYDISLIESPESSVSASSIIKYLSGNPPDLTSIVFAEDREAQQASWKSNLKTNPQSDREIKINDSESENTYYLGWKSEKPFEAGLFNNYANRYIGPLASLMGLPYKHGIRSVDIKPGKDPFVENFENMVENREDWHPRYS
ncbi:MAG: hypothetical protein KDD15_19520, partial [Lewinella sp.]|nr:hypothetical protein [Lewinella sp.]